MSYILDSMEELKLRLLSDDFGKHLMGVEDLLQKHSLVEADINVLGERVKQVIFYFRNLTKETKTKFHFSDTSVSFLHVISLSDYFPLIYLSFYLSFYL